VVVEDHVRRDVRQHPSRRWQRGARSLEVASLLFVLALRAQGPGRAAAIQRLVGGRQPRGPCPLVPGRHVHRRELAEAQEVVLDVRAGQSRAFGGQLGASAERDRRQRRAAWHRALVLGADEVARHLPHVPDQRCCDVVGVDLVAGQEQRAWTVGDVLRMRREQLVGAQHRVLALPVQQPAGAVQDAERRVVRGREREGGKAQPGIDDRVRLVEHAQLREPAPALPPVGHRLHVVAEQLTDREGLRPRRGRDEMHEQPLSHLQGLRGPGTEQLARATAATDFEAHASPARGGKPHHDPRRLHPAQDRAGQDQRQAALAGIRRP
jgi:hypothetical protein